MQEYLEDRLNRLEFRLDGLSRKTAEDKTKNDNLAVLIFVAFYCIVCGYVAGKGESKKGKKK